MLKSRLPSDQGKSGRTFGEEELELLREVLESGTLTATKGRMVKNLAEQFGRVVGSRHVSACSSGTAAIHAAIAALDTEPGDEIITTSITDMGALAPILYQGAIPVFADVDPDTYVKDLTEDEVRKIRERVDDLLVEGDLRREQSQNIKRLMEIGAYRGLRHRRGLPVNGQRTKTNARTRKGPKRGSQSGGGKKKVRKH